VKAESEGSVQGPGKEPGSVQQDARTCPVCGTKFFATADSGLCPVLYPPRSYQRGVYNGWGTRFSIWFSRRPWETEATSQARRFEHYEVMSD